jgi:hypothetical protein
MNLLSYCLLTVLIILVALFSLKTLGDVVNDSFVNLNDRLTIIEEIQKERK